MDELTDSPISPELALVCPELRERAIGRLSDRPWDDWRARPASVELAATPSPHPAARAPAGGVEPPTRPRAASTTRSTGPATPRAARRGGVAPRAPSASRAARRRATAATVTGRVLALVLVGIVMAVAAAVYASEVRPPASTFETPGSALDRGDDAAALPGAAPTGADGDWVFGETGRFRVEGAGSTVTELLVTLGCARELRLTTIPVDASGRFAASGTITLDTGRTAEVGLVGRFLDAWTAAVEIEVQGGACSSERLRAVARLR